MNQYLTRAFVLFELMTVNEFSPVDFYKKVSGKCCNDPLRPPRFSGGILNFWSKRVRSGRSALIKPGIIHPMAAGFSTPSHHCRKLVGVVFWLVRASPLSSPSLLARTISVMPWAMASDMLRPMNCCL